MKELTEEVMNDLMNDEAFISDFRLAKSAEEARAVLIKKGINISEEEFRDACTEAFQTLKNNNYIKDDGELTEKGLEMVAGGYRRGGAVAGIVAGTAGLLLMMSGPIGWGAIALWAGGCAVAGVSCVI